jgi:hypothetical protein
MPSNLIILNLVGTKRAQSAVPPKDRQKETIGACMAVNKPTYNKRGKSQGKKRNFPSSARERAIFYMQFTCKRFISISLEQIQEISSLFDRNSPIARTEQRRILANRLIIPLEWKISREQIVFLFRAGCLKCLWWKI